MQSVTNIFIVNLAMADMLVMLFCAPPSVIWDVTNTWIFGSVMCKVVIYIQVLIKKVIVLIFIGIKSPLFDPGIVDRMKLICFQINRCVFF